MQVGVIGHSQGATLLLALLARRPEFGSNFGVTVALAPCVHIAFMKSPVLVPWCKLANVSGDVILSHLDCAELSCVHTKCT